MNDEERHQAAFQRPKRWWPAKEWKRVQKQKVFGITASNGEQLSFLVPKPWSTALWAEEIKDKVIPFLKRVFPGRTSFVLLLDGESLLHGPAAKLAFAAGGMSVFPGWCGYSPDLNPQENVWQWAEDALRDAEQDDDSFEVFQQRALRACKRYPYGEKLVPGVTKRMQLLVDKEGCHIGK